MDWTEHFQPAAELIDDPRPLPVPVVFEGKEHSILVLQLRERLGQQLLHPRDDYLAGIHDRVGYQGEDRRSNGTDLPTELSPFGEVVDDDEPAIEGWDLKEELEDFRARRVIFLFGTSTSGKAAA